MLYTQADSFNACDQLQNVVRLGEKCRSLRFRHVAIHRIAAGAAMGAYLVATRRST